MGVTTNHAHFKGEVTIHTYKDGEPFQMSIPEEAVYRFESEDLMFFDFSQLSSMGIKVFPIAKDRKQTGAIRFMNGKGEYADGEIISGCFHNVSTQEGDCGSPILDPNGCLLGIHRLGNAGPGKFPNKFITMSEILESAKAIRPKRVFG
jgi:hypothetical protein